MMHTEWVKYEFRSATGHEKNVRDDAYLMSKIYVSSA